MLRTNTSANLSREPETSRSSPSIPDVFADIERFSYRKFGDINACKRVPLTSLNKFQLDQDKRLVVGGTNSTRTSRTTNVRVRDKENVPLVREKSKCENVKSKRSKPGSKFFITVSLNDLDVYKDIKRDFVESFSSLITYCCSLEKTVIEKKVNNHLHCYLHFDHDIFIKDLVIYCNELFPSCKFDILPCRSTRNVLKYITKEDYEPYYNCSSSKFHFNFLAHKWAVDNPVFRYDHPFVLNHRNCYRFLISFHQEVRKKLSDTGCFFERISESYLGWPLLVATWWNSIIKKSGQRKRRMLYLYGDSNVGKSTYIENLIGLDNLKYVFYPGVGKFFMQDFDVHYHKVVLFEEFEYKFCVPSFLKRLLEGRLFAYPVKGQSDKIFKFDGPIIFISNFYHIEDIALLNRLFVVEADSPYWENESVKVPKEENDSEEIVVLSSSEDELSSSQQNLITASVEVSASDDEL